MPATSPNPPSADPKKAEKYISQFVSLINSDKLQSNHTDLSKFDPSALQDHYRVELDDFNVEVSHSKQPNSGADSYVMVFTNIRQVSEGCEKIILAYLHLDTNQFIRFKAAADDQIERKRRAEEEKKFNVAVAPIDNALEKLEGHHHPQNNHQPDHQNTHHFPNNKHSSNLGDFQFPENLNKPYQS